MATILIIGDDPRIRSYLRDVLHRVGHGVVAATTSHEGVHLFLQIRIELVIADVFMPDTDGLELIKVLHQASPTVPIIGFSGRAEGNSLLDLAKTMGAQRTLENLFPVTSLIHAVQEELQKHEFSGKDGP